MMGLIQKLFRRNKAQPQAVLELGDIQGLIISSYGHLSHSSYLFFEIKDPKKVKNWLDSCLEQGRITSALRKDPQTKESLAMNLALTAKGIEALGASETLMESFSYEFRQGMQHKERSRRIGDFETINDPTHWDDYWKQPVHLMLALQSNEEEQIAFRDRMIEECQGAGLHLLGHESGYLPQDHKEHFGFTDSISQPTIEGSPQAFSNKRFDSQITKAGEFILGYINEDGNYSQTPFAHISEDDTNSLPALPDRSKRDFGKNGTYFVYRKMEQDVARWRRFFNELPDGEKMAAKAVGRWPSGVSLVDSPDEDPGLPANKHIRNDFGYRDSDPDGSRCPFASHVRRLNPRDSQGDNKEDAYKSAQRRRIIRRGTIYGDRLPEGQYENGEIKRGLHFFCINSNIRRQFEFLQQSWVNNPKFHGLYDERDPLIGVNPDNSDRMMTVPAKDERDRMMTASDKEGARTIFLPNFVHVKGGEYFFLPSLAALKFLTQL